MGFLSICRLGVLLVYCVVAVPAPACGPARQREERERCLSERGVNANHDLSHSATHHLSHMLRNTSGLCSSQRVYTEVLLCLTEVEKRCRGGGPLIDVFPETETIPTAVSLFCHHVKDVDVPCVTRSLSSMKTCVHSQQRSLLHGHRSLHSKQDAICRSVHLLQGCIQKAFHSCSGRTAHVLGSMVKVLFPAVFAAQSRKADHIDSLATGQSESSLCGNISLSDLNPDDDNDDFNVYDDKKDPAYRWTTVSPPLPSAPVVSMVTLLPSELCSSHSKLRERQLECFRKEDLRIYLPEPRPGQDDKQSILDAIAVNHQEFRVLCQPARLTRYQRAVTCAADLASLCVPESQRRYVPDASGMRSALTGLCHNADAVDQSCVLQKTSDLMDCSVRKAQELPLTDVHSFLCGVYKINVECQKEVLSSCGCQTARVYMEVTKRYLNPSACPDIEVAEPDCHAPPQRSPNSFTALSPLITWLAAAPGFSCPDKVQLRERQLRCFSGHSTPDPHANLAGGYQPSYLDTLLSRSPEIRTLCLASDLHHFQRAWACVADAANDCAADSLTKYLPDTGGMRDVLTDICRDLDTMNLPCVQGKQTDLVNCFLRKADPHMTEAAKSLCSIYTINVECQSEVLASCGCPTAHSYVNISLRYLRTSGCPAIAVPPPVCETEAERFVASSSVESQIARSTVTVLLLLGFSSVIGV